MKEALEVIRKNLLSVICGVVALLAVIAAFFPLSGWYDEFQRDLNKRAVAWQQATSLLNGDRYLPIVQSNADRVPLPPDRFPNPQIIDKGNQVTAQVTKQAADMLAKAVDLNVSGHTLLMDQILPVPGDRVFDFRRVYLDEVQHQIPLRLGAVMPPNADEINAAADALHQTQVEDRVIRIAGQEVNRDSLERDFADLKAKLPDQLREERATKYNLYMDNTALSINPVMTDPSQRRPTPSDVFYSQLTLWVEEDVASAIIAVNSKAAPPAAPGATTVPSGNILTNPIKRLVHLGIDQAPTVWVLAPGVGNAPGSGTPADDSGAGRDFSRGPSGRYCNSLYDVVDFTLSLEVDQRQVPIILDELQRNRLMTVLGINIDPVDSTAAFDSGYIYGPVPMVQISMQCEALFFRKWTVPYMPDDVKMDLHIITAPPNR